MQTFFSVNMIALPGAKKRKMVLGKTAGAKQDKTRTQKTAKRKKEVPSKVKCYHLCGSYGTKLKLALSRS